MTNPMSHAWNEARRAAGKFGGRPADYFREALRLAWADHRAEAGKINVARLTDADLGAFHNHLSGRVAELEAVNRGFDRDAVADVRRSQGFAQNEMNRRWRIQNGCAAWTDTENPAEWTTAAHGFKRTDAALSTAWGVRSSTQLAA